MKYKFLRNRTHDEEVTFERIRGLDERYPVPLYIYNEEDAVENANEIKTCLGEKVRLCYSAKANYYLTEAVAGVAEAVEVCTIGELKCCLRQGIPAAKLIYNGVWKSRQDMEYAIEVGIERIILDSMKQISELQSVVKAPVKVLFRLSSGNQFGMNVEEIEQVMRNQKMYDRLDIAGIHYYAGTQRSSVRQIQEDFRKLTEQLQYLQSRQIYFEELEIGGGIGIPLYFSDKIGEFEETVDFLFDFIKILSEEYKITYECGRAIAANAGCYITKVFSKKQRDTREIILVHGGSNHISYYGNIVGQRQPFIKSVTKTIRPEELHEYMICGSLCSANDIVSMKYTDYIIEEGDYMIFYNVGAYSLQEASTLFLTMEMPQVLLYNGNINGMKLLELGWRCGE